MKKITLLLPLLVLAGCYPQVVKHFVTNNGDSPIIITDGSIHFKKAGLVPKDLASGSQATFHVTQGVLFAVVVKGCSNQDDHATCTVASTQIVGSGSTPATSWTLKIYHKDGSEADSLALIPDTPTVVQLTVPSGQLIYKNPLPGDYEDGYPAVTDGFSIENPNLHIDHAGLKINGGPETRIDCPSAGLCRIKIVKM
ncbi:MAG: hypothetical protein ABSF62_17330 [Bryobacteraceae bacterium]